LPEGHEQCAAGPFHHLTRPPRTASQLAIERQLKVSALEAQGLLESERIKAALLKVPREDFIPAEYRDFAYEEVPLPLPAQRPPSHARIATPCFTP